MAKPHTQEELDAKLTEALQADDRYSDELQKLYGHNAGDMRYETMVQPAHVSVWGDRALVAFNEFAAMVRANRKAEG